MDRAKHSGVRMSYAEPTASQSAAQDALDSNAEHGQREALNPLPEDEEKS